MSKWNEENVATLIGLVGADMEQEVPVELQKTAAEQIGVTLRSVASKLRNLGYKTASSVVKTPPAYTPEEEEELRAFVESNPNQFTYAEIAEQVLGGSRTPRQIQGKLLSMELFGLVKPTEKQEAAKVYSDEEEAIVLRMMEEGAFLEDIAEAVGKPLNSVRGKALAITRKHPDLKMPKQKESHAKESATDLFDSLDIEEMTVAEIAEAVGKTERGVKTTLTRRGLTAKDYDGAKRAAKLAEKKAAEAA